MRRFLPKSTAELIHWYERYVSPLSLLVGFALDVTASHALDLQSYGYLLSGYLFLAAAGIIVLQRVERGGFTALIPYAQFVPLTVQFGFGGLYSGFVILYSKSASLSVSWIFIVLLAALLLGNERFGRLYARASVQFGILFLALYSFCIFYVPVVLHRVSGGLFLVSGIVAVIIMASYALVVFSVVPSVWREYGRRTVRAIAAILVLVHVLYVLNAIPPLPLALKDAGVFHSVVRSGGDYTVTYEPRKWYEVYLRYNTIFHKNIQEPVYVYTAVFAPSGISTGLVHEWQFFDPLRHEWVTRDEIVFPISGGRSGGYRGYTLMRETEEGYWRVNVKTDYGRIIGRVTFEIIDSPDAPTLLEEVK